MNGQDEQNTVLRIGIDGRWEATEFAKSLTALDRLYSLRFALDLELDDLRELRDLSMDAPFPLFPHSWKSTRRWAKLLPPAFLLKDRVPLIVGGEVTPVVYELFEPQERLVVQRIIYGSPGIKDLAGIGEIVGHLKDLLVRLIEYWSTRRQRELENNRRELENQQLQVEVAKQFVGLAQELGYSKRELRQLVASVVREQKPLIQLVAAGKITSADTIDNEQIRNEPVR
jgi:HAMP domain-containing protein